MLLHVGEGDIASSVFRLYSDDVLFVVDTRLELSRILIVGIVGKVLSIASLAPASELVAIVAISVVDGKVSSFALEEFSILLLKIVAIPRKDLFRGVVAMIVERDHLQLSPWTGDVHVRLIVVMSALRHK